MNVQRLNVNIKADINRVLLCPFKPLPEERSAKIVQRVLRLPEEEVQRALERVFQNFEYRHRDLKRFFLNRFEQNKKYLPVSEPLSENRKMLIGSYFSHEYSLEAASLFNPSMVWHPEQSDLPAGSRRFIISLRATGEGHVSSLAFRSGVIDADFNVVMDDVGKFATAPEIETTPKGYRAIFSPEKPLSERVLFPVLPEEKNGIEDVRLVEFQEPGEAPRFYGTYVAYDGKKIRSMMLETTDFQQFNIYRLKGAAVFNKNLALFPRKINGQYAMLSRQDNENNYIMFSDNLLRWKTYELIMEPHYPWEFFQIGNCGSPLETEAGWVVLSHGVGTMREYVISAFLLDRDDPRKVIGRLKEPLLRSNTQEREGYVPNVVYTCGGQIFHNHLIFPYAMSDYASSFAMVNLDELLRELTANSQ
ncbi:MAG: glycoside hydrolase family 130 protein [Calditrichia bacterium]